MTLVRSWGDYDQAAPLPTGTVKLGTPEHLMLMSRTLLDSHDPYRPAIIDWPTLDEETRSKITSLPIWDIAVATEGRAGMNVRTFAEYIGDPLLKAAVEMDAFEESRHKLVLSNMVQAYGIELQPEPAYVRPRDPEFAFMRTGYSECIDSFFGFGLFKVAKDSGFFPAELVDTFEPVMREEGRHILFFVNWVAWWRRNMPWWRRPWFEAKVLAVWFFLIWERIDMAKGMGDGNSKAQENNFTLNGSKELGVEISFPELARVCLSENDRRLGVYDQRLIRPRFVPAMMRLALRFVKKPRAERCLIRSARAAILLVTIVGLAIAGWTIGATGLGDIARAAARIGVGGFLAYCLWSLGVFALLGAAWLAAAPDEPWSRLSLFSWARMVREAASDLLPFSQLGGIVLSARVLGAGGMAPRRVYGSLVVDMTTEMAGQLVYTLCGLALMASLLVGDGAAAAIRPMILGGTALMIAVMLAFFGMQRGALDLASAMAGGSLPRSASGLADVRAELQGIYARRGRVLLAFLFNLAAWVASGAGAWIVLRFMGLSIAFWDVLSLESLIFTLRSIAFFVPGAIGVQEAAYALIGHLFGLPAESALALSLAKRARDIALGVPTLLVWQAREMRAVTLR